MVDSELIQDNKAVVTCVICVFGFYFEEVREITVHLRLDLWLLCAKYETHIILENKLPGKDNIMDC